MGCVILLAVVQAPVSAEPLVISIGELDSAINELESVPDAISRLALRKIQEELNASNFVLGDGEILFTSSDADITVESGCTRTEIRTLDTSIALASNSSLSLTLASLYEPVLLSLELDTRVSVNGRAKQVVGFRLGSCQELAEDNFSFTADGSATLFLQLELVLNPTMDSAQQVLLIEPVVNLTGELSNKVVRVNVEDSILRNLLEDFLEDEIDDALADSQIVAAIGEIQEELNAALDAELDEGKLTLELPAPNDEQIEALYDLLSPEADFLLSRGYLRVERVALLAALILGDEQRITDIVSNAAQCEAAGLLQVELEHKPVYQLNALGCQSTQVPNADSIFSVDNADLRLFGDAQCQRPIDYIETTTAEYCATVLDVQRLGNADSFSDELGHWTLSPGTQFDIGAVPLGGLKQPFTQRVSYKTINTAMGECSLEMRVHRDTPLDSNSPSDLAPRQAVIAFHGGSWQRRSSGALGVESMATQFVNAGFVVFAPFYRLIGTDEGNEACNDATLEQVIDDAYDALDWVQENGSQYGVSGKPVLFGQSAGGHLAAVMAVERPDDVGSSVLFYAPTDFAEFARRLLNGELVTRTGQGILEAVVGQTLETLDVQSPIIQRNALAARVAQSDSPSPPFFLLHGSRDTVLPVSQSVRMCNAIAGNPDSGPASSLVGENSPLRQVVNCGADGSELHLIAEGEHALDLCIADELCLAGSPESAALTSDSIRYMLEWVKTSSLDNGLQDDQVLGVSTGQSSGSIAIFSLLFLCVANILRRRSSVA